MLGGFSKGKEPCSDQGDGGGPGQMDVAQCAGGVVPIDCRSYRLPPALPDPSRLGSEALHGGHCGRGLSIYPPDWGE